MWMFCCLIKTEAETSQGCLITSRVLLQDHICHVERSQTWSSYSWCLEDNHVFTCILLQRWKCIRSYIYIVCDYLWLIISGVKYLPAIFSCQIALSQLALSFIVDPLLLACSVVYRSNSTTFHWMFYFDILCKNTPSTASVFFMRFWKVMEEKFISFMLFLFMFYLSSTETEHVSCTPARRSCWSNRFGGPMKDGLRLLSWRH